jgi:hypothetical protein
VSRRAGGHRFGRYPIFRVVPDEALDAAISDLVAALGSDPRV